MDSIPNTDTYMIAGFIVSFAVMGIYLFSMYVRSRNLKRDLETYEAMEKDGK